MKTKNGILQIAALLGINFLYALVALSGSRVALVENKFSLLFFAGIAGVFVLFGVYAILWQQILKHVRLSTAYMFKGTSLLFVLLLSVALLGEAITMQNIAGAFFIIVGIVLFNRTK